ncbi:Ricin-type beta-trefoil lectin domain containing protein [Pyrenophora tritici-repentis]|uniref:Ricin-type beta-trefoil lectin domain containing protein n=1 Tax=Pyrenophora tritici-repentis TaxID=45151 RepID=A0A922NHI1_9PLEO|nr:Ricin-type beta-trefoil lectin domain containing protein [Pyrenophora tritici-repentis]
MSGAAQQPPAPRSSYSTLLLQAATTTLTDRLTASSDRTPTAKNTHFEIVAAGGTSAKPEIGDREYHIIAGNSGLYLACDDADKITVQLRAPLDASIRWKLAHVGNGAFCINSVNGKKQLNVRGAGKENGTEMIMYDMSPKSENAQFILKAVV